METVTHEMMSNCLYSTREKFKSIFPLGMVISYTNLERAAAHGIYDYHLFTVLRDEVYAEYESKRKKILDTFIEFTRVHYAAMARNLPTVFNLETMHAGIEAAIARATPQLREILLNALFKQPDQMNKVD